MSIELQLLGWSVVLLFAYVVTQVSLATRARGMAWNAGARDEAQAALPSYAGRAQRALDNFKETWPAFIALALALAVTGRTGGMGALGAWIWFIARIVYLPLYLLGVPGLRTLIYAVSVVGLVLMLARLF